MNNWMTYSFSLGVYMLIAKPMLRLVSDLEIAVQHINGCSCNFMVFYSSVVP